MATPLSPQRFGDIPPGFTPSQREYLRKMKDALEILMGVKASQLDTASPPLSKAVTFDELVDSVISDDEYSSEWDGVTDKAPSKGTLYNALLQTLLTAAGDMVYASAANTLARLAKGTANYKMFMNAAGTAPEWATGMKSVTYSRDVSLTSDWALTGAGFKPSALIAFGGIQSTSFSWGFLTGGGVSVNLTDYGSTRYIDQACVISAWVNASNYQQYALKSFDADGVTLEPAKTGSPTGTLTIVVGYFR